VSPEQQRFREYVAAHQQLVFGLLLRWTHNVALAEELTNDVFLRVWRSGEDYTNKPKKWVSRIALNVLRDHLRLRRTARAAAETSLHDGDGIVPPPDHEARFVLLLSVEKLPAKQREVFELFFVFGCTVKEVADDLSIPVNTVKSRLNRAKASVKESLGKAGIRPPAARPNVKDSPAKAGIRRNIMSHIGRSWFLPIVTLSLIGGSR